MRTACLCIALLVGPVAAADEKPQRLGSVPIDGYEATVTFEDWAAYEDVYRVTLTVLRPKADPPIDGKRFHIWLLDEGDREQPAFQRHHAYRGRLVETPDGDKVVAKVIHGFDARSAGGLPVGVVVAVDGEPKAFRLPRDLHGVDPKTVAAWERAGAYFQSDWAVWDPSAEGGWPAGALPTFDVGKLKRPARGLPLPDVPFGLQWDAETGGPLAGLPGRDKAQALFLRGAKGLSAADRETLAGLTRLKTLSLSADLGDADAKALGKLTTLQQLSLWGVSFTDAGLKEVGGLTDLRTLSLSHTAVTGKGLAELAGLKELRVLDLVGTPVGDADLKPLAGLANLEVLNLRATKVTGPGLSALAGLTKLRVLDLSSTELTDAGLKELAGVKSLKWLNLNGTKVTGVGLKHLAGLTDLESLDLGSCPIDDAGVKALAGLTKLRRLYLGHTPVGDGAMEALAGMRELRELRLSTTKVGDAGCRAIGGLKGLRVLDLFETKVTDAGVRELAGLPDLRRLNLRYTTVTDAGMKALSGMKQLEVLEVGDTPNMTEAGVDELRHALPWTHIPW